MSVTRSTLLWTPLLTVSVLSIRGAARARNSTPDPMTNASGEPQNASEIAKKSQNPIGDLISVPFRSNTNFNADPHGGTQEILNIQPVIQVPTIINATLGSNVWGGGPTAVVVNSTSHIVAGTLINMCGRSVAPLKLKPPAKAS